MNDGLVTKRSIVELVEQMEGARFKYKLIYTNCS